MKKELFNRLDPSDRFWLYINEANGSQEKFYKILSSLTLDELRAFKREFKLLNISNSKEDMDLILQKIAKIPNINFALVRDNVISKGYNHYKEILDNPNKLNLSVEIHASQTFLDVITKIMYDKYTNDLFDHKNSENKFWKYIEDSEQDKKKFYQLIWHMSLEELRAYEKEFDLAQQTLWNEGEEIGLGDDLEEIRLYVISQGYNYFMEVIQGKTKFPEYIGDGYKKILKGCISWLMYEKYEA